MIAFVKGEVAALEETCVIVENQGIGYQIFMPGSSMDMLRIGEQVRIYTYLHVKEDLLQLYGFLSREDLRLFKLLLGVNGVGPKAALGILSAIPADDLQFAVLSEDVAAISKAPGIGKKTAQKLILELKDKLSLEDAFEQKLSHEQAASGQASPVGEAKAEAVAALTALGYANSEALRAVNAVEDGSSMDVEQLLKAALKYM